VARAVWPAEPRVISAFLPPRSVIFFRAVATGAKSA